MLVKSLVAVLMSIPATVAILGVQVPAVLSGWSGHRLLFSRPAPWLAFCSQVLLDYTSWTDLTTHGANVVCEMTEAGLRCKLTN